MFKPFVREFWNLQLIRMCSHEVLGNTVLVGNKRRDLRNQEQSYGLKAHFVPQNRKLYSPSASLSQKYELSSIIGASVKTVCPHPIQDIRWRRQQSLFILRKQELITEPAKPWTPDLLIYRDCVKRFPVQVHSNSLFSVSHFDLKSGKL